jgi:hypothetical protein
MMPSQALRARNHIISWGLLRDEVRLACKMSRFISQDINALIDSESVKNPRARDTILRFQGKTNPR